MDDTPEGQTGTLRFLKVLVTALTVTMIVGLIVLIALIVMRFPGDETPTLPDQVSLPAGTTATAITRGPDWLGVVTADNRILILELDGVTLRQEITITPAK